MNSRNCSVIVGALLLLLFATRAPAPQVPGSAQQDPVAQPSDPVAGLVTLSEAQTAALNSLREKLASIDKRVLKLEKEKNNG